MSTTYTFIAWSVHSTFILTLNSMILLSFILCDIPYNCSNVAFSTDT